MTTDANFNRALHAVADPTRRRILQALKERTLTTVLLAGRFAPPAPGKRAKGSSAKTACLCAGDIQERMRLSQPTISHHMAILAKAGLVEALKRGQWRWYRRNENAIRTLVKTLRAKL